MNEEQQNQFEKSLLYGIFVSVKGEVENIFEGAIQSDISEISPQISRTVFSISAGEGTRVHNKIPKNITIRRDIVLKIVNVGNKRGINPQDDLYDKSIFMDCLNNLIVNLEENKIIDEFCNRIRYVNDCGILERKEDNDYVHWETEIRFATEAVIKK